MHGNKHIDYDEESFSEKVKKRAGIFSLIASGLLSILHTLSHIVPALGVIGFAMGDGNSFFYKIVSSDYMQIAYFPFVILSFYYMYRDHQHHKHERELRKENEELRKKLKL